MTFPTKGYFLATCQQCEPLLPMPFTTAEARDEWKEKHESFTKSLPTGAHTVEVQDP